MLRGRSICHWSTEYIVTVGWKCDWTRRRSEQEDHVIKTLQLPAALTVWPPSSVIRTHHYSALCKRIRRNRTCRPIAADGGPGGSDFGGILLTAATQLCVTVNYTRHDDASALLYGGCYLRRSTRQAQVMPTAVHPSDEVNRQTPPHHKTPSLCQCQSLCTCSSVNNETFFKTKNQDFHAASDL